LTGACLHGSMEAADTHTRLIKRWLPGPRDATKGAERMRNHIEDVLAQLRDAIAKKSMRERDRGVIMELDGLKGALDHIVRAAALEAVADAIQDVLDGDFEKAYAD
jgi:hypothetical protein